MLAEQPIFVLIKPPCMKKIRFLLVIATILLTGFTNKPSAPGDWRFIADKWVSFGVNHDIIVLGNANDAFTKLKLRVTDGPLKIYDMKVHFDNGSVQDVSIRNTIRQGGETRVIDLDGGTRHLSKIEFWYETKGFRKGKARVAVWGKQ
jgi:hypothetical protein